MTVEGTLSHIRIDCDRVVDDGTLALQDRFATEGEGDDPIARKLLTRAVSAAVTLRDFLDAHWDFGVDDANPKEEPCPE